MIRAATLLAGIAAALSGLVLFELSGSSSDASNGMAGSIAPPSTAAAGGQAIAADAAAQAASIMARPLFRIDRRPLAKDAQIVVSSQFTDLPRLAGILLSSDARKAMFQAAANDKTIVVGEGETVGNWRVRAISADSVTLEGPGGTRRLGPKFAPNSAAPLPMSQPVPQGQMSVSNSATPAAPMSQPASQGQLSVRSEGRRGARRPAGDTGTSDITQSQGKTR